MPFKSEDQRLGCISIIPKWLTNRKKHTPKDKKLPKKVKKKKTSNEGLTSRQRRILAE